MLGCAKEGAAAGVISFNFAETKVGQEEVTFWVQQTVLGLQVSVHHPNVLVKMGENKDKLREVKYRGGLREES